MQHRPAAADAAIHFSGRDLARLIWPLIIEQFLALAVGLADSIMVSSVGEAAVSAISLVDNINVLLINAFTALAAGGAVVCGQYMGRRQMQNASGAALQLLAFMGAVSLAVTGALYAFRGPIMGGLFGAVEPAVMSDANTYYLITEASVPFLALYAAGVAVFRVMGNSAISMQVSTLMNVLNVAGNAALIYGLKWGVAGAALPTLLSRAVAAVLVLALLCRQSLPLHISLPLRYTYDGKAIGNIVRLGVPAGIESSLFQLGKILLLSVASVFGTAAIAANAIGNTVGNVQVLVPSAVSTAMITVISQCVGAGDYTAVRRNTWRLMRVAYGGILLTNILLVILQPFILRLYNISDEAVRLSNIILWMHGGFAVLMWPMSFTFPNALKAAGDSRFVMWVGSISMWTFRVGFGILFSRVWGFGILGIWMCMFIDWACRITCFLLRWRGTRWQTKALQD